VTPSGGPVSPGEHAFGREFDDLMRRRRAEVEAGSPIDALSPALAADLEQLIRVHAVAAPLAQYVRHVLRCGFDSEFDAMDPPHDARGPTASGD